MRDKAEARREEKLAIMQEQIKNGTLVIRQMTAAERELYPPRSGKRRIKPPPRLRLS